MNRNKSSNFSLLPEVEHRRSRFDLSSSHKFTFNIGEVIPFYVQEILPGSTVEIKTSKLVRLQTPLAPIMDNIYLDTYYFFVPNRLVWDDWKKFQGENESGKWSVSASYEVPSISFPESLRDPESSGYFAIGSVADYMGLPSRETTASVGSSQSHHALVEGAPLGLASEGGIEFNALPFRAYCLICNEWFRDENLDDPLWFPTTSINSTGVYDSNSLSDAERSTFSGSINPLESAALGGRPFIAAKYHDYFTSCLPDPLKTVGGAEIKVPITNSGNGLLKLNDIASGTPYYIIRDSAGALKTSNSAALGLHSNALVDGEAGITINSLRLAFATQSQYELDARGGTRYTEILRSNFGVVSPDARLQRPEYLGGNHIPLNIQQIVQQSGQTGSNGSQLGDTGAFSATADSHGDFIQSFTEHGFIIGVCVARYDHSYQQGAQRFWFRKNRFDYYMPAFANLGEQPVFKKELYIDESVLSDSVFGYQEAWSDYRYMPNRVSGEMRSDTPNSLDIWHLADDYSSVPSLSSSWLREDKSNVDRVLSVSSGVSHQLLADFYIDNKSTLPLPMYSIPATLGHF